MKLMVNHQTHYAYSQIARNSVQSIKMMPQSSKHQQIETWQMSVPGQTSCQRDAFNNVWMTATQRHDYRNMTIMAQGIVEMDPNTQFGIESSINPKLFLQPTPSTLCNAEMKNFAKYYVPQLNRANLIILSEAILNYIPYVPDQTSVQTSAIEAFQYRQGVCQDHSHVFIAMCKYLGVPARYVSGYLFVPNTSHLASHAWAEVFFENSWYCFDISNQLFTPNSHIYVAIGRDYWDVAPVRGIRERGGTESMNSIVQVLAC